MSRTGREILSRSNTSSSWGLTIDCAPDKITISQIKHDSIAFVSELEVGFIIKSVNGKSEQTAIMEEFEKQTNGLDISYERPESNQLKRLSPQRLQRNSLQKTQCPNPSINAPTQQFTPAPAPTTTTTGSYPNSSINAPTQQFTPAPAPAPTTTTTGSYPNSSINAPTQQFIPAPAPAPTTTTTGSSSLNAASRIEPEIIDLISDDEAAASPLIRRVLPPGQTTTLRHVPQPLIRRVPPPVQTATRAIIRRDDWDDEEDSDAFGSDWDSEEEEVIHPGYGRTNEIIDLISSDDEGTNPPSKATNNCLSQVDDVVYVRKNKRKAVEELDDGKGIKRIKVKKEFEALQVGFGEANVDDEVVEVLMTKEDDANDTSNCNIIDLEDDDELKFVGGNMQVMSELPHGRKDCPIHQFDPNAPYSKNNAKNMLHCKFCYCYMCDVEAKDCDEWSTHCSASYKNEYWKKQKELRKLKIFKFIKSKALSKLLEDNKAILAPNLFMDTPANASRYQGHSSMMVNAQAVVTYFNQTPELLIKKAAAFFMKTPLEVQNWLISDLDVLAEFVGITASIIKIFQLAKQWPNLFLSSGMGDSLRKCLFRIFLRCRDNSELMTSMLDDIRPIEDESLNRIVRIVQLFMQPDNKKKADVLDKLSIDIIIQVLVLEKVNVDYWTSFLEIWPSCTVMVICHLAKEEKKCLTAPTAKLIQTLFNKLLTVGEEQRYVVESVSLLSIEKSLTNIFIFETIIRNAKSTEFLTSCVSIIVEKVIKCCDFNKYPVPEGFAWNIDDLCGLEKKAALSWISTLETSDSVYDLLISQSLPGMNTNTSDGLNLIPNAYDSVALATCIRALSLQAEMIAANSKPINAATWSYSKLSPIAVLVISHVVISMVSKSENEKSSSSSSSSSSLSSSSSSVMMSIETESESMLSSGSSLSSKTLNNTDMSRVTVVSNILKSNLATLTYEVTELKLSTIFSGIPAVLLDEWCRIPEACDPHMTDVPSVEELGISLNGVVAKALSKAYLISPHIFKSRGLLQAFKTVWKALLNEYLDKKNKYQELHYLSSYLDAVEHMAAMIKTNGNEVELGKDYIFPFKMLSILVLCRRLTQVTSDTASNLKKAATLIDDFAKGASSVVDLGKKQRVTRMWSSQFGKFSVISLPTYILFSDWQALSDYAVKKGAIFITEFKNLCRQHSGILTSLSNEETNMTVKILSDTIASVAGNTDKSTLNNEKVSMNKTLAELNESIFISRAILISPDALVPMALNALSPINLNKLIEKLNDGGFHESITQIKNDFIASSSYHPSSKNQNMRSVEDMFLLAISLNLPEQAAIYVTNNISALISHKIVIETLTHILEKSPESIEKLLDAILPFISHYMLSLKTKDAESMQKFIKNNNIKWNELSTTSLKFAELNVYCNCNITSVEKYMTIKNSAELNFQQPKTEETQLFKFLDKMYQAKYLKSIDYLKIVVTFCGKSKLEKEIIGWVSDREIYRTGIFFEFIYTCLEFCGRYVNLRHLLYCFISKLIIKRSADTPSKGKILDDKIRTAIIYEVNMGGLSTNAMKGYMVEKTNDINFKHKDFTVPQKLSKVILDFHDSYYFLRLIATPSKEGFEQVKQSPWYESEKKNIISCLLESGTEAIDILMHDGHGAASILDKLQDTISSRQIDTTNVLGCNEIIGHVIIVTKALTKSMLQPNSGNGIAGLFCDVDPPFIRVIKYLLSLSFYLKYLQVEVPTSHISAIISLQTSITALVDSVNSIIESHAIVTAMLNIASKFDVESFSSYTKECSKFDAATKNKLVFALDTLINHAASRIMSPSQRIDVFKTLLNLCKDASICNEIQCLTVSRRPVTLSGSLNGVVIQSKMSESKSFKAVLDECGPLVDQLVELIKQEGKSAAIAVEEVVATRPSQTLKILFKKKPELFALIIEHNALLQPLNILFDIDSSTVMFSVDRYASALEKCPLKWKTFFIEMADSLFSEILDRYNEHPTLAQEEEVKKQITQFLKIFSKYQPGANDKTLENVLKRLESTIKLKLTITNVHLPTVFKSYTHLAEYDPCKLIYFDLFLDIIFFRKATVQSFFIKTATNSFIITQYKNIWTNFKSIPALFFAQLQILWFKVLEYHTNMSKVDANAKKLFEEFIEFFKLILNSYPERGSYPNATGGKLFWNSIKAVSVRSVTKKTSIKKIVQAIDIN